MPGKRWTENLVIFEKDASWDLTLDEASPFGGNGMRGAFVGSVSWDFDPGPSSPAGATGCAARLLDQRVETWLWAGPVQLGVGCGRCRNSQHSKKCVCLSPRVERLKVKKWINVSYLKTWVVSVSGFLCLWIFYIFIFCLCYT